MRARIITAVMLIAVGLTTAAAAASTAPSRAHSAPGHSHCRHGRRCAARSRKAKPKRRHKSNPMPGMNMSGGSMPMGSSMPSSPAAGATTGSSSSSGSPGAGGSGTTATPARLQVTAREFSLTLSHPSVLAGPVVIELVDLGQDAHNIHIRPSAGGADVAVLPTVQPGSHYDQQVTLAAGTYTVYCAMPGHERMGMAATLTVN